MRHLLLALSAVSCAIASPAAAQDQPYQRAARQFLERIVAVRSAEGQGGATGVADIVTQTLRAGGVPEGDITRLTQGETAALIVRIPGSDPAERPIAFMAHMDVVDARPEDWTRSPFQLVEENGTLYGRGVSDNKTGVTSLVSTILRLRADNRRPRRTLLFVFTGDEETSGDTAQAIARHPWLAGTRYAINTDAGQGALGADGRPFVYLVQAAEKTYATFRLTATNEGGHSSRPRDDNAIYDLAAALERLQAYRFPVLTNAVTLQYFRTLGGILPGEEGALMRRFAANPQDAEAAEALRRRPEFVGSTRTTCVPTRLDAGHADNALPQRAAATVNCRIFPGTTIAAVRDTLQQVAGTGIAVEITDRTPESPVSDPIPEVMAAIARSVQSRYPGLPVATYQEPGATDGLWFRVAGIPTLASSGMFYVPGQNFEHGLNERLPAAGFYGAIDHIHDLAVALGGGAGTGRRR